MKGLKSRRQGARGFFASEGEGVPGQRPGIGPPRRRGSRRRRRRRGAVLVEAILVLPVFLLLLMGFIQFSSMYFTRHTMLHAAREGARALAVQDATTDEATARTRSVLTSLLGQITADKCQIISTQAGGDGTITVAIPAADASIIGDPFGIMGSSNLTAAAVMRDEDG